MSEFVNSSHDNSHNTTSQPCEGSDANYMVCKDAPGETRTPNLLIRSQYGAIGWTPALAELRAKKRSESVSDSPTETPKRASASHDISHNTFPDIYADSRVFLVWGWAA